MSSRCDFVLVVLAAGCAAAGCATAGAGGEGENPGDTDASVKPPKDASQPIDGPEPVMPDAPCTTMTTQLLANPAFDLTPMGMAWTEEPFDPTIAIITSAGPMAPSTPYKAWLGGYETTATDVMYQDVVLPNGTTMLTLSGSYAIGSLDSTTVAKDTTLVELLDGGAQFATIMTFDNTMATTGWMTTMQSIPVSGRSGHTIRLRFTARCDASANTNFFFDSLSLTASHCQ
ncbi:MAG: hypothetical protein AB7O24_07590 [Kofleriaceae bacterium]